MAENGCSRSQYDLARLLLRERSDDGDADAAAVAADVAASGDRAANDAQGVHWLLRAADQGHTDAVLLLAECYATRRGINHTNEYEVQTFLGQSSAERAARRAARELFACLSHGEHYITAAQLERKMRRIWNIQKRRTTDQQSSSDSDEPGDDDDDQQQPHDSATSNQQGRVSRSPSYRYPHHRRRKHRSHLSTDNSCITEAHLVSAAVNYSHGRLPAVSQELTLSAPAPHALDHIPCFHRLLFHPLTFILLCYHRFVNTFAQLSDSTAANVRLIVALLLYTFLSSDNLATFAPLAAHYVSLGVMFVATLRTLKARQEFIDFRMWSGLFLSYGDHGVDAPASENQFLRRRMQPYLWFFGAFCANVMLTPLLLSGAADADDVQRGAPLQDQWMAHSEITVLAFILVFVTMLAPAGQTRPGPDWLLLVSFGVNVLAKYPYEMDDVVTSGWRFLDLKAPNFSSFVLGNGIEFCLSCRALLYLLIPGVLVLLARRRQWHGTYQFVIPHCVTLAWLQICILSAQSATWFGLVRAALGLAGLMLFLPLFGIVTLMIPVFAAVEWLSLTDPTVRMVTFAVLAAGALTVSCCVAAHRRTERYVTVVQVFLGVTAAAFLALPYMMANFDGAKHSQSQHHHHHHHDFAASAAAQQSDGDLSWPQFYEYCQQPAWDRQNGVRVQLRCADLDGTAVRWEADVSSVQIAGVHNWRADVVHAWLPTLLAEWTRCLFGQRNRVQCSAADDANGCDGIAELIGERKRCNLNAWATYDYELLVRMPAVTSGGLLRSRPQQAEVVLRAAHEFGNFTQRLNASDRVWFRGVLRNSGPQQPVKEGSAGSWAMTLGKRRPHVEVVALGCVSCPMAPGLEPVVAAGAGDGELRVNARVRDLCRGVKYLLNVLFNPLVTFK